MMVTNILDYLDRAAEQWPDKTAVAGAYGDSHL